ncbi:MAG: hypothetical protein WCF26_00165, partial [Candidatus Sulfotelmatobacter sp.]
RMIVTTYNQHVRLLSSEPFGWFAPPKFTRAWEPTLLWNHYAQNPCEETKKWPHFWGHVQRLRMWWAISGKAMQGGVPAAGTPFREVTQHIESEGHVARVCGLLVQGKGALAAPKWRRAVIRITQQVSNVF